MTDDKGVTIGSAPRERTVETRRFVRDKRSVRHAPPLLSHRTKKTYFDPHYVTIEAHQNTEGQWFFTRATVSGYVIVRGNLDLNRPGYAYFDDPLNPGTQPAWVTDHIGRLLTELVEKYPPGT
jgi:hypothetical protein